MQDAQAPSSNTRSRRRTATLTAGALGLVVLLSGTALAVVADRQAGPRVDGTAITPNGYRVTPVGAQTELGDLPLTSALSPNGRSLLVVNAGQGTQSVQVVDTRTRRVVQTLPYTSPKAVYGGAAFSPDGRHAYVSGGGDNVVHTYSFRAGRLREGTALPLPTTSTAGAKIVPFPAGLAVTPDGRRLVVADQLADAVSVVDVASGAVQTVAVGAHPYGVTLTRDGDTAYVAEQGADTVSVLDVRGKPVVRTTLKVGTHPNRSVLSPRGDLLYVANGDSDDVTVLSTETESVVRTIDVRPYAGAPVGSNPDALAVAPDGRTLYVANAGNNDVAVVDLQRDRVRGLVPTAWYPTSLVLRRGRLWITNAKGYGAGPNDGPGHPDPTSSAQVAEDQYVGSMIRGTLSTVSVATVNRRSAALSRQVVANNGFDDQDEVRGPGRAGVVPRRVGEPSAIKHVIYVVKENRTYDQEFGDLGRGDGDPSLTLFGDESATNIRALARQFTTFDNFYADAEVSAGGWNWSVAANSNPFAEQQWPANYSGRGPLYPSESADPAIAPNRHPDDAYIWQRLRNAGVSFRNYGFYVNTDASGVNTAVDPVLQTATNPAFRGYDLSCPDSSGTFAPRRSTCGKPRVDVWLDDFRAAEKSDQLPAVQFVRLPNDHTAGTRPGSPTPRAYVADNDYALGRLVDAVTHSQFWDSTAIFVTEDDAQNGPDHVDAHRTTSLVISPWTQTGRVDSTFYDTASMLRTIELVVGVGPLTQFDAFATPMAKAFTRDPDLEAYDVQRPPTDMTAVNAANAPLAAASARQDLSREDRVDEYLFNKAIWKSVKGGRSTMPAPRNRFGGVRTVDGDD